MAQDLFEDLEEDIDDETFQKILVSMLDKESPETKTQIERPLKFTQLELLGEWYDMEGIPEAKKLIGKFCTLYRINMISYKRQSRKEVVQVLAERVKEERALSEKMASREAPQ